MDRPVSAIECERLGDSMQKGAETRLKAADLGALYRQRQLWLGCLPSVRTDGVRSGQREWQASADLSAGSKACLLNRLLVSKPRNRDFAQTLVFAQTGVEDG